MFVIDASVALAWCFDDESSVAADRVLGRLEHEAALVPAHWPLEIANALRTAERRDRVKAADLPRLRALLARIDAPCRGRYTCWVIPWAPRSLSRS